jgi:hypothetical protein
MFTSTSHIHTHAVGVGVGTTSAFLFNISDKFYEYMIHMFLGIACLSKLSEQKPEAERSKA